MAAPNTKTKAQRNEQRAEMFRLWREGVTKRAIAVRFGCHETNVGKVINRMIRDAEAYNKKARSDNMG